MHSWEKPYACHQCNKCLTKFGLTDWGFTQFRCYEDMTQHEMAWHYNAYWTCAFQKDCLCVTCLMWCVMWFDELGKYLPQLFICVYSGCVFSMCFQCMCFSFLLFHSIQASLKHRSKVFTGNYLLWPHPSSCLSLLSTDRSISHGWLSWFPKEYILNNNFLLHKCSYEGIKKHLTLHA